MQPAYLPWLGYFHRVAISDLHIVLDHVEIDRNSKTKFANRNKVRTNEGWCWLTVPLLTGGRSNRLQINQLEIDDASRWRKKHWSTMQLNYSRSSHFEEHESFFKETFERPWRMLSDLQTTITKYLLETLAISTPVMFSSQMGVESRKDQLILDLCRHVNASQYISGPFGREYLSEERFVEAGIQLRFHEYRHPVYQQAYPGFEPFMSVIDLLFNCGAESSEILRSNQEQLWP
jgi:hypothetical protein